MAKKALSSAPQESIDAFDRLVATQPSVERKGASVPYTSINGHMFSYLIADGTLALKLPSPDREEFLATFETSLVQAYGVVQKEYVQVPVSLLLETERLAPYFELSLRYTSILKPKATKIKAS